MGAQLGSEGAIGAINMTPLIDIVLVVLIIMMVNIPIQIEEMGVKLPGQQTTTTPPPSDAEQLVVALYEDDKVALNRKVMAEDKMLYELGRRLRPMTKKNVFIDAAATVPYGRVVDMVDLAREAGAERVGLARMKDEGPLSPTDVDAGGMPRGVFPGSPSVVGAMTEKQADAVLQRVLPKIKQCYAARVAMRSDLAGNLVLKFEVGPQGEMLSEPEIEKDGVGDLDLRDCVKELLPSFPFQPLGEQKTAAVRYSLLFSPG
jgi:biopolymer transport protein ExbD